MSGSGEGPDAADIRGERSQDADPRAERGEATRSRLVATARGLFAERGFAEVGTEEVVRRAGVTRGALYHHFRDKRDLFRAVYEQTEQELVAATAAGASEAHDPWQALVTGVGAFLDACSDPAMMRIGVLDAPAVLGWREWREIGARHGLGLIEGTLRAAMDAGTLRRTEVEPLARLLFGTLGEAAQVVANADDPAAAREEVERTLVSLLEGLRA
jgi:AcrR family transcriptional regulator